MMETKSQADSGCAICGQARAEGAVCRKCQEIVTFLREHRAQALELLRAHEPVGEAAGESRDLPDVLDAVRYRARDRDNNAWYVSVSEMDGHPVEIFASTAFDRDHHLQSRISNLTTITRLVSLILRNVFMGENLSLEKILTQLLRSSRQPDDLPMLLAGILGNYHENYQKLLQRETDGEG
ncbi:MAG: hypothetical protein LBU39_04615 [Desulfobulbaceae bacterium]|nr:hypothetical protein [Desulfobulbaceae bacterium]